VRKDIQDKLGNFINNPNGEIVKRTAILKILKWLVIFLMIFVVIRLSRIYLFNSAFG
jgi:uncharacterized protein YpmB